MSELLEQFSAPPLIELESDLEALRKHAQKVLMQHGFPQRKTEAWKYTPIAALERRDWSSDGPDESAARTASIELPFDAHRIPVHNGQIDTSQLNEIDGLHIEPLRAEQIDTSAYVDHDPSDAFAWLNLARLEQGICIRVTHTLERPLALQFSSSDQFKQAAHPRIRIELAEGVEATLFEQHRLHGSGLINLVMDLQLAAGSSLQHLMQRQNDESALIARTEAQLEQAAHYQAYVLDLGGALTRQDLKVHLNESRARTRIHGVAALKDKQLVDYHTAIQHRVGPSHSEEDFRILADNHSMGVFNGRIHMLPGADDSHSDMNTANLLLSEHARINTKPELEIHAEEVTASHGATVGQLEEAARFYLRSRGLNDAEALALLKFGFAAAAFDALESEPLRQWFTDRLKQAL